jgi:hypothetical protein
MSCLVASDRHSPVYRLVVVYRMLGNAARWVTVPYIGLAVVGLAGAPVASADPPPLPPTQPFVPGTESAPYGPEQFGAPGWPIPPPPAQFDARGVGVGTNADLGASPGQMPNALPGTGPRTAFNVGPTSGVIGGSLSGLDPGATVTSAPPPTAGPIPVPTVGVENNAPIGLRPDQPGPLAVTEGAN